MNDDVESIIKEYSYLRNSELAFMTCRSIKTVERIRARLGLPNGTKWSKKVSRPMKKSVQPPTNWDSKEWFEQMYNLGIGMGRIAFIINRSYTTVRNRFIKYKIPRRTFHQATRSKNKCCHPDWLEQHYVIEGLSLVKCAKLAKVSPYTIYNWLIRYKIHIRDRHEAVAGERNPAYGKKQNNTQIMRQAHERSLHKSKDTSS